MWVAQQLEPTTLFLSRSWQLSGCRVVRRQTARCICCTKQRSPLLRLGSSSIDIAVVDLRFQQRVQTLAGDTTLDVS